MSDVDKLFASPLAQVSDFVFDHDVARVFPDMIKRSIPGYPTIVENIGVISAHHAQPGTLIYDLGCSLGAATQSIRRHLRQEGCRIIGVACRGHRAAEYSAGRHDRSGPGQRHYGDIPSCRWSPARW